MKKRKRGKLSKKPYSKKELIDVVLSFFRESPHKNFNYKQLYKLIGQDNPEIKSLIVGVLIGLQKNGSIIEIRPGKYKLSERSFEKAGVVKTASFRGLLVESDDGEEIFIGLDYSQFAFIGDRVLVLVFSQKKGRKKGEVLKVLERKKTSFVGVLQKDSKFAFLIPDNKKVPFDIFIPKQKIKANLNGKKLLVEVTDWSENRKNPVGKIISVIGEVNNHNTEINSILYDYGFDPEFPKKVEKEASKFSDSISIEEINKRLDVRKTTTFTIDPKDAKDFDDALSVKKLKNGNWEIGVHIADVSYYVKKGGIIDKEAVERATSVYLVDRVIPMLPEVLSNNLCSLKPNVDRLAYSVLFEMDEKANLVDYKITKTVIHSDVRFTYKTAQDVIDNKKGKLVTELLLLDKLSKILRKKRQENGSINFESTEVKFILDKDNNPIDVSFKESLSTNHLIEEFMLLANKTVAKHIGFPKKDAKTFVYRIHDTPDNDRISTLNNIVKKFGHSIDNKNPNKLSQSLNYLLKNVKGKKEQQMVETLTIRSMAKAVYSTNNIGHYGLAFDYYSHFTSPIRRYPDLIVHRLLEQYIDGENSVSKEGLEKVCKHCSEMEKVASTAERDSIKYMQVKYMQPAVGKVFSGVISGVTEWGLYVELDKNKCEGLVKIKSLKEDYFIYEDEKFALTGIETNIQYQLGQKVKVKVKSADLEKKQLNFIIV
ncbi:MAG: ribonuclease R [Flavobacteriales bacterium]|nr:ribonuclease R [Flavobacteriales bacterium]